MSEKLDSKSRNSLNPEEMSKLKEYYSTNIELLKLQKEYHQLIFDVKEVKYKEIMLDLQFSMKNESAKKGTKNPTEQE